MKDPSYLSSTEYSTAAPPCTPRRLATIRISLQVTEYVCGLTFSLHALSVAARGRSSEIVSNSLNNVSIAAAVVVVVVVAGTIAAAQRTASFARHKRQFFCNADLSMEGDSEWRPLACISSHRQRTTYGCVAI